MRAPNGILSPDKASGYPEPSKLSCEWRIQGPIVARPSTRAISSAPATLWVLISSNSSSLRRPGLHRTLSGTVTDHATGKPIAGATVSDGTDVARTNAQGGYSLALPVGSHDLTVTAFGYADGTAKGVTVTDGTTVTKNIALTQVPSETVSGKVTDGSGHGWPIYAQVQVAGQPTTAVYTDPATGHYSLSVPEGATY